MNNKILVTLGPSSLNKSEIQKMDTKGVFVYRINLSHTPIDNLEETIKTIRSHTDTPICLDSEGAQIRNQNMINGQSELIKGEQITIHYNEVLGDSNNISFTPNFIVKELKVGDIISIDFDSAAIKIEEVRDQNILASVIEGGLVGSNKAADLNRQLELPPYTTKDKMAFEIGMGMGIKHFALSFASRKEHVDNLRDLVGHDAFIISKIENCSGLLNLPEILESTSAILIDRGDLSRQVSIEKIPFFQRRIIATARTAGKPVFVATNLLETMITNRTPTRAEVNDIVSTLEMGANGLVLAAETAIGHSPFQCVKMIKAIIHQYSKWTPNTSIKELLSGETYFS